MQLKKPSVPMNPSVPKTAKAKQICQRDPGSTRERRRTTSTTDCQSKGSGVFSAVKRGTSLKPSWAAFHLMMRKIKSEEAWRELPLSPGRGSKNKSPVFGVVQPSGDYWRELLKKKGVNKEPFIRLGTFVQLRLNKKEILPIREA